MRGRYRETKERHTQRGLERSKYRKKKRVTNRMIWRDREKRGRDSDAHTEDGIEIYRMKLRHREKRERHA